MPSIYVATHGVLVPRTKVRVPAGVTLHYYSQPGELTDAMTFLYVLAGGRMKPVRSVTGPCEVDQILMTAITEHEHVWAKELAGMSGLELFCAGYEDAPPSLCTQPAGPLTWSPCTTEKHTCGGYFGRFPKVTEIHLSACQPYANLSLLLAVVARRITKAFPQNERLRQLAEFYLPLPPATSGTMAVGHEEETVYGSAEEGTAFEIKEEIARFISLAEVDKHAAWQRFLSYKGATKILLGSNPLFRSTLEVVQKAVVKPRGGQGWLRLDELAVLKGTTPERILEAVWSADEPLTLEPSPSRLNAALYQAAPTGSEWRQSDTRRNAASWLGVFRDWLRTPAGQAAAGIDGEVAVALVNWLTAGELDVFYADTAHFERFRALLDFSESTQDARHPVAVLFPEDVGNLAAALEKYVKNEQALHQITFRGDLALDAVIGGPDLFLESRMDTVRSFLDHFTDELTRLEQQREEATSADARDTEEGAEAARTPWDWEYAELAISELEANISKVREASEYLAAMAETYSIAFDTALGVHATATETLAQAYDLFADVTFTEDDLTED